MKRRHIHLLFGTTALAIVLATAWQCGRLAEADRVNGAIARADASSLDADVPEARFAQATALAKADNFEAAAKAYKALIQGDRADLKRAALFNLGNLHIREALKTGGDTGSLPLIELAKQNYRDLLREDSSDWDARYNLERALWLAPEIDEIAGDDNNPPEWRRRVTPQAQGYLIELP